MGYLLSVHQQVAGSNPVWRTLRKPYSFRSCGAFSLLREFCQNAILLDIGWMKVSAKERPRRGGADQLSYLNRSQMLNAVFR